MTWSQVATFAYGTVVVILDALIGPLYRHVHRKSFDRHPTHKESN